MMTTYQNTSAGVARSIDVLESPRERLWRPMKCSSRNGGPGMKYEKNFAMAYLGELSQCLFY